MQAANGKSYINVKGHNFYFTIHPEGKSPQKRQSSYDYDYQVPTVRVMMFLNPQSAEFRVHENAITRGWSKIVFSVQQHSRKEAKHQDTRLGKDYKRNACSVEMIMPPKSKDEADGNAVYSLDTPLRSPNVKKP